jgi:hypothetical protein
VAVGRRVGPGRGTEASRHDVAVGDQARGAFLATQGDQLRALAQAREGEEARQGQALMMPF